MFDHSGQQIVIVTTIWWWRRIRERLAVNKQRSNRFDMERFNLKKLKQGKGKEQYRFEVSIRFAPLEDLNSEVDINSAWETIREKLKPWFDEGCSELLDRRKQAKLEWLQDQSEINGDNLNSVRREVSRYFRSKKREYLKDKLATNSKSRNIRDMYNKYV
jgi:hypothetical protein